MYFDILQRIQNNVVILICRPFRCEHISSISLLIVNHGSNSPQTVHFDFLRRFWRRSSAPLRTPTSTPSRLLSSFDTKLLRAPLAKTKSYGHISTKPHKLGTDYQSAFVTLILLPSSGLNLSHLFRTATSLWVFSDSIYIS